jgi:hypothetical protein
MGLCLFVALTRETDPPKVARPAEAAADPVYQNDILFYRRMVGRVRGGMTYHDAANIELREHGFKPNSLFNWRLPTYAWVLSALPGPAWGQWVLAGLTALALILIYGAERRESGAVPSAVTVLLSLGVFLWWGSADAVFWQEVWAAVLIGLSLGALGLGQTALGVSAAVFALCWRELALPYCLIAAALAGWHGRRRELAYWAAGLALFAGLMTFHAREVFRRLAPDARPPLGVSEWVEFGGITFNLMATRTNLALATAPGWVLALYLGLATFGLAGWRGERGALLGMASVAYLGAFSVFGKPYNFYWGWVSAPFLPFGLVRAPAAIRDLSRAVRSGPRGAPPGGRDS